MSCVLRRKTLEAEAEQLKKVTQKASANDEPTATVREL